MQAKHSIKRAFQRIVIRSKRHASSYNSKLKLEFEDEVLQGCRNLIHKSTVKLYVCPDTGRKFIVDSDINLKMVITDNSIILSNNDYYREISISARGLDSITRVFNGNLRKSITALDTNIHKNAQFTLNNVTTLISFR